MTTAIVLALMALGVPPASGYEPYLGSADWKTREAASRALGRSAAYDDPLLGRALHSASPEVALRARKVYAAALARALDALGPMPCLDGAWYDVANGYYHAGGLTTYVYGAAEPDDEGNVRYEAKEVVADPLLGLHRFALVGYLHRRQAGAHGTRCFGLAASGPDETTPPYHTIRQATRDFAADYLAAGGDRAELERFLGKLREADRAYFRKHFGTAPLYEPKP